jgi:hypothetical protein
VSKEELFPKTFKSIFFNSCIILILSIFSIGIVFGESKLLNKVGFPSTPKTVTFVIPSRSQYRLGEIFGVDVDIFGVKAAINTVQADLSFDPENLQILDISTADSFATVFIQKEMNNSIGYARLTGGLPNPGFGGNQGRFATFYFKGIKPGLARVAFLPTSLVLANDGGGTNVLKEYGTFSYLILPEKLTSEEESLQKTVLLGSSTSPEDVMGVSSDSPQLHLYQENSVLGVSDPSVKLPSQSPTSLGLLSKIDAQVLNFWDTLFQSAKNLAKY